MEPSPWSVNSYLADPHTLRTALATSSSYALYLFSLGSGDGHLPSLPTGPGQVDLVQHCRQSGHGFLERLVELVDWEHFYGDIAAELQRIHGTKWLLLKKE